MTLNTECSAAADAGTSTVDAVQVHEQHGVTASQPLCVQSAICEAGRKLLQTRLEEFSRRASDAVTTTTILYGCFYEGRSINKLQNVIILLIFKMWKFRNGHFLGDLILNTSCEFYYDDVTVTSFINIR